jgi:predicted nucleic-acid-binding protein
MKAIDTNILARFLLNDDPVQSPAASVVLQDKVFVSHSVLLETVWLLASRYDQSTDNVATALLTILQMPGVFVVDRDRLLWALERYRAGADFADMVHLVESAEQDAFVTFDRKLAKQAGPMSPTAVEVAKG